MLKKILTSPFFIFPLLACLVFWPFTFQVFSLKNDALTYYYPIRTLISDALNNAELPLWTPFINMGYPLHADMQSGAWNPVLWIFSLLSNYSLAAFHYELLFYIAFAGIGFYFLCREFGCNKPVAFTMAIAYQFSGFMIDSVQFFTCISAACYLPYVFIFFRRTLTQHKMKDAIPLAFFMFLLFTGGYPSLFIITCYTLFAYAIFLFFCAGNKIYFLKRILFPFITACLFFVLLSLPAIISFLQHIPEIERGKPQALSVVLENSMNPSTLLSLLSPFSVTANNKWLDSSILMRNIYIGIIPLVFLIYACFNKTIRKNKEIIFFFVCAVIMLGLAFGKFFFLRELAYHTLPLMKSFRHPALFRLFSIFFFLLIAARSWNAWLTTEATDHIIKRIFLALLIIVLATGAGSIFYIKNFSAVHGINSTVLKDFLLKLNFQERWLVQLPWLLLALALSYIVIKKKNIQWACLVIIADMFLAAQFNMPVTVYGAKSFATIERTIGRNPTAFPLPGKQTIEENSENSFDPDFVAGSKIPFSKKIGRNDYFITPGNLSTQDEFYESPIKNAVFMNPVMYFADTIIPGRTQIPAQKGMAFNDDPRIHFNEITKDTGSIEITGLSANSINASVSKKTNGILIYQQNNYHGWNAFIDGKQTVIKPINKAFMAIEVPAGDHLISFKYKPALVLNAWHIAAWSFILMIIIYCSLIFSSRRSAKRQKETG